MKLSNFRFIIPILWSLVGILAVNWIIPLSDFFIIPNYLLGLFAWAAILFTIAYFARDHVVSTILIFMTFFCLGYFTGPFLEPPADPIEHLQRTYAVCQKNTDSISKTNRGFFHYNMSGVFLCPRYFEANPEKTLRTINALHGVYWGLMLVTIVIVGRSAGLPDRWAFAGGMIAFLFFGTNRFSYFSYYSFSPSFSSLTICWLWTAKYFFKTRRKEILSGLIAAIVILPVLWANHEQEAVFLVIFLSVWLFWTVHCSVWDWIDNQGQPNQTKRRLKIKISYCIALFAVLFVLPQFVLFNSFIGKISINNFWSANQNSVYFWHGLHISGKVWGNRIHDTLGMVGFAPLILFPFSMLFKGSNIQKRNTNRIILLALVPFFIYFLPLFHVVWLYNVKPVVYWRVSYASMYWLFIAYFLYRLGERLYPALIKPARFDPKSSSGLTSLKWTYFAGCVCLLILIGGVRSPPFFGKLDFILLDGKPWWGPWREMINETLSKQRKYIISDSMTSSVFSGVFNQPTIRFRELSRRNKEDIELMDQKNNHQGYRCIINLKGFSPSWVASETGHWQSDLALTDRYYNLKGMSGEKLKRIVNDDPINNCRVYR